MIVWPCRLDVSTYAARGRDVAPPRPACPRCGGPTGPWSGYVRHLRDAELHRIFVPRVRCRRCGRTAALLPWFVTPYRWDTVDVIGRALELSVSGQGVRRIAPTLDRPETTVREWCRRFRATAEALAQVLLAAAVRSGPRHRRRLARSQHDLALGSARGLPSDGPDIPNHPPRGAPCHRTLSKPSPSGGTT